ncbi:nucleotide pyrophosphatase [Halomicrobium mukohataei]|uniref:Nucleotide pyrophosphatase n=1 Tax=Halomicrobium mukohataei TaxID=57705 RepID=A0A847U7V9_9EURY|nr:alkaline phosphatase family protein [Halomicrobium mukohataei]NLV08387.1 nucleotide pyrophosphatase [Halomicrobium mukohataei]
MTKTIVIGLDGSNWPLICPWIDKGYLPNFAKLRNQGAYGISRSYLPPVTCPNWKCYASGKNPGKLGVYWWERIDTIGQSIHLPDATDFTSPEIWDYLNDAGKSAGVINLPMTYPPREIDDFMIAGGPRSRERNYTKPEELQSEVEDRFGYRVHPQSVLKSNENAEEEVEMIHDLLQSRLRTAYTLCEERDIDFLHVTLFHLNVLQHYFWNGDETRRAYEIIDEELGRFIEEDYNLVLMSDHGCTEIDTVFYINHWLAKQGYLSTETTLASRLHDIGVTQERIASLIDTVGLEKYIRPLVPRQVIERFPSDEGVVREEKLNMVDWDETKAIGSGQGLIYVVADSASKRSTIIESLKSDLQSVTGVDGRSVVQSIHDPEEIYNGEHVDRAPDLVFDQRPGVHTSEAMGVGEVVSSPTGWRGENVPDGMVLFHGDDIQSQEIDPIRISDIAPTVLHWMGLDIPTDIDGTAQTDIFTSESPPAQRNISKRQPLPPLGDAETTRQELDDNVENRLEDIGYLE